MKLSSKLKNNPWYITLLIIVLVLAWMASGIGNGPQAPQSGAAKAEARLPDVRIREQDAELVPRYITVYGRSEPARTVIVKAETDGQVVEVAANEGSYVSRKDTLLKIDMRDRREQLARAEALLERARIQYEGQQQLKGESFVSRVGLSQAAAELETAKAELARIRIDLRNTRVQAPFDGSLQKRMVEVGDYVKAGDPVAEFVDIDTLIISGSVSETERANLEIGSEATAKLITGDEATGSIRYIAPVAEEETRTFLVEIEVENPDHQLPAGVTAEISLPVGTTMAHRISPAILTLDKNGDIGVKTIDAEDRVSFNHVDIVKSGDDGVWVTGLPEQARIITVGQGFVKPGDKVNAVAQASPDVSLAGGRK